MSASRSFRLLPLTTLAAAALAFIQGCAHLPAHEGGGAPEAAEAAEPAEPTASGAEPGQDARHAATPAPSAAAGRASAPAAKPGGPTLPPFATVIKDAHRIDGLFSLYQKDEKVFIELRPQDFNRPLFFSPKLSQGLGEAGIYGGLMAASGADFGGPQIVEFRRIFNTVHLVALNPMFRATPGSPEAHAVAAAYATSLLASVPVLSRPSPDTQGVLVEANGLFITDVMGMSQHLQQAFHQNYGFDPRNSFFDYTRDSPGEVAFGVRAHFGTGSIAVPAPNAPPGAPVPTTPSFVPDVRSLFLGLHYSLAKLPDTPMVPRRADPRVGYFTTTVADFSDDLHYTPRERFVNRWRLEKKDPSAPLSEPVRPIVFWLDRSIPLKYRESIRQGVLEWNKAFERIGFRNAIVVEVQPEGSTVDTLDGGAASVRWAVDVAAPFVGIGPSHVDPRSGEILDADVVLESLGARELRAARSQVLDGPSSFDWSALLQVAPGELTAQPGGAAPAVPPRRAECRAGDYAAEQLDYALDVMQARGEIDPDSPEADAFVQAFLKSVTMHEVGHALGLRHNFRASRLYTDVQVSDPAFTKDHALAASVMDYLPVNLPRPGEAGAAPFPTTIGPYDYWAIEYAYKLLPAGETAAQQRADLQAIAARGSEPANEFGTDEDAQLGIDPESLMFDLGSDPIAFAQKRFAIVADLFHRQETRQLKPDEDYSVLRRSIGFALRDAARAAGVLVRQLGGVATLRDYPGSGRDPLQPVPAARQREALDTLITGVLAPESFHVSPTLQRRLAPDYLERGDASAGGGPVSTDYPVESVMLEFQRELVAALMSDGLARRLEDGAPKLDDASGALLPREVYARLTRALWSQADNFGQDGQGDIPERRRELQRDYVNRLANVLLRTPGGVRVDMRSNLRAEAIALLPQIEKAAHRHGLSEATRLHLSDCAETLRVALAAPMQRAGY